MQADSLEDQFGNEAEELIARYVERGLDRVNAVIILTTLAIITDQARPDYGHSNALI